MLEQFEGMDVVVRVVVIYAGMALLYYGVGNLAFWLWERRQKRLRQQPYREE